MSVNMCTIDTTMVKRSFKSLSSHNTPLSMNVKNPNMNNAHITLHHVNHNHNNNVIHKMSIKSPKSPFNKIIERFVQSIVQANDSSNFDNSFEVKDIQCTRSSRQENRCVTSKSDKELMRFAREFEICQINNGSNRSTPKTSPYLCRKAKAFYENLFIRASSSRESSPKPANNDTLRVNACGNDDSNEMSPLAFHRTYSERSSSRSAKVLQLFVNKKVANKNNCNAISSSHHSPVLMRAQVESDFVDCSNTEGYVECQGDEISLNDSNCSSSSYELHPPLLPTFKVTPSKYMGRRSQGATTELAQFLRCSFHAKRANIAHLRRSLSDTNNFQNVNFNIKLQKSPPPFPCLSTQKQILANTTYDHHRENTATHNCSLNSNTSPFRRRWGQSLLRLSSPSKETLQNKSHSVTFVHRAASMTTTTNDVFTKNLLGVNGDEYHKQEDNNSVPSRRVGPVSSWAISFEQLLEDTAGLKAFAEFLKLEYSAENIFFWTACERYRLLENESERVEQAKNIFYKHLANGSSEPVNVDSQARNLSEGTLDSAQRDVFAPAQKQIFNLMKFDSYPRFIRSNLYRSCLQAEEKGEPLPLSGDNLDELFKIGFLPTNSSKLKKSASNAEDRRRKSLLPWHRKTRSKSRERIDDMNQRSIEATSTNLTNATNTLLVPPSKIPLVVGSSLRHSSINDFQSSRSSVSSLDNLPILPLDTACALCRVKFTDGATTMVQTKSGETVGQLVERLLEKRGIRYRSYDVVIKGNNRSIDLQASTQEIAGKEIEVEQRAAFKLDLPNPKVISVKSKPKKLLYEVVKPILSKYNYEIQAVEVLRRDTQEKIDLMQPVTAVDGQRLQVIPMQGAKSEQSNYLNDEIAKKLNTNQQKSITYPAAIISQQAANIVASRKGINISTKIANNLPQSNIKEITNKIFQDVMQKNQPETKPLTQATDQISLKSDGCNSNSSSLFELTCGKPDSTSGLPLQVKRTSTSSQHSTDINPTNTNIKKPIIAKLKAGVKLQVTERVNENQEHIPESPKKEQQLLRAEVQKLSDLIIEQPKSEKDLSAQLRQMRANLFTVAKNNLPTSVTNCEDHLRFAEKPQPVPRLSITSKAKPTVIIPAKGSAENTRQVTDNVEDPYIANKDPPPLPPKPKVLPTKPSNWGVNIANMNKATSPTN
uniref:RGS domain-containing protein n=1 Tax=Glossina palpalis gambiensis TaxID=67801 RepID=A0A1B0BG06_9MUSC